MIIGKPLTALGGGGLTPIIRVTAKAGALLRLTQGVVILGEYQLGADETQHDFTVRASENKYTILDVTNNASVDVLVDGIALFKVWIAYGLYLYRYGDKCVDVTGGWSAVYRRNTSSYYTRTSSISFDTEWIKLEASQSQMNGAICANNRIDVSGYKNLCVEATNYSNTGNHAGFGIGIDTQTSGNDRPYIADASFMEKASFDTKTIKADVSNISGTYYVILTCVNSGVITSDVGTFNARITKIWLE